MAAAIGGLLLVAGHTLVIYLFLILCLTFLGRREIAQLTFVELAVLLLLGSAVETAMIAGNTSLLAGLVSASTLLLANRAMGYLVSRWSRLRQYLIGAPVILVQNGHLVIPNIRMAGLTVTEVLGGIRERGYAGPEELRYAILEVDGTIGIVPMDDGAAGQRLTGPIRPPARPKG